MPLVRGRLKPLAREDVAQVAATIGAHDFRPRHAEGAVLDALHGARDAVEVGRPAAAGLKLCVGRVQRRVAGGAGVDALARVVLVVDARAGGFGALLAEDAELLCSGACLAYVCAS